MNTSISSVGRNSISVHGVAIDKLIANLSIADCLLLLGGVQPDVRAAKLVNAMAVGFCDHGLSPPSTISARLAASCGVDLSKGLIAALACMGDTHAPICAAMDFIGSYSDGSVLPRRVPGFGHPIHDTDPRVDALVSMAVDLYGADYMKHCRRAEKIESLISARMNYAGAVAAICLDLGIDKNFAMLIVIMGRLIGLTAHYNEQVSEKKRVICYDESTGTFLD